jgi:colanic acid biosynthesis glycosyl transferase WcaI
LKRKAFSFLFPNWVDTALIRPLGDVQLRREMGIGGDDFVALYSGSLAAKQGLETVIEAAWLLAESQIRFVICGEGPRRERLHSAAAGLPHVSFMPLQPVERLNQLLNVADVHLLPQRASVADLVMPSKLTGMLASGRPVVATAHLGTQVAQVVNRCGLVVPPEDATSLAGAVVRLASDPALCRRLGAAARELAVQEWDKSKVLTAFENELLALTTRA